MKIFDDNTIRHQYQIKGGSGIDVSSDGSGNITIANGKIKTFTYSLKVTQSWTDTGIVMNTTNFPDGNGCYAVYIDATAVNDGTDLWARVYSGVMSVYTGSSNATNTEEVILHSAGHASAKRLYLRVSQQASSNNKIQVAASADFSVAKSLVFKFRKLI